MLLDDEKATNDSLRLVCGAGRQMGATNESTGLVSGAGRPVEGWKADGRWERHKRVNGTRLWQMGATNESTGLVSGAGRSIDVDKGMNESLRLVRGAGRPIVGMDRTKTRNKGTNLV